MKIGVISDTHDQIEEIKQAVTELNEANVDLVIHCGDWVSPFVLVHLTPLKCSIKGVFGNNDGDRFRHVMVKEKLSLNLEIDERFLNLTIDGRKIAVFHGDYAEIVDALVHSGTYDAVFHGHTHLPVNQTIGKTLSLNPGSFLVETTPQVKGASYAIYDTQTNLAEIIPISTLKSAEILS